MSLCCCLFLVLCFAHSRPSECSYQFYCSFALTLIYCTCYFMLCFVLFFASRLSFITVCCCCCWWLFLKYLLSVGCGKRLRTSTTLPHFNIENIISTLIRTTNANYQHTDSLASAYSTLRFLCAPQNSHRVWVMRNDRTMKDFFPAIINYVIEVSYQIALRTVYCQHPVLSFAREQSINCCSCINFFK